MPAAAAAAAAPAPAETAANSESQEQQQKRQQQQVLVVWRVVGIAMQQALFNTPCYPPVPDITTRSHTTSYAWSAQDRNSRL
jgi:hypothetical protein